MDKTRFHKEQMTSGHFALFFGENGNHTDIMLISDPACEDYYDEETADCLFDDYIEENCSEQWQKTILSAISEGWNYNDKCEPSDNQVEAENYLIDNTEARLEHCELHCGTGSQNYSYKDHVVSGDIFNFDHYRADNKVYFHICGDEYEPVDWFAVPSKGDESRNSYIFVYDTIVYDGEVLNLFDYFE